MDTPNPLLPFYAAFNTGDVDSLDRVFAADWRDNTLPPGRAPGLAGMKQALLFLRTIVPDLSCRVEDFLVDGDKVVARVVFEGRNSGGFPGVGPNGQPVRFIAFDVHHLRNGMVFESWHLEDNLTLMIQLGVVPPLA